MKSEADPLVVNCLILEDFTIRRSQEIFKILNNLIKNPRFIFAQKCLLMEVGVHLGEQPVLAPFEGLGLGCASSGHETSIGVPNLFHSYCWALYCMCRSNVRGRKAWGSTFFVFSF